MNRTWIGRHSSGMTNMDWSPQIRNDMTGDPLKMAGPYVRSLDE